MRPLVRLAVPLLAGAVAFVACGGDDGGNAGDNGGSGSSSAQGEEGEQLFKSKGCASCHGTGIAPELEGVFGSEVELEDGSTVTADDAYLRRSIKEPGAQRVAGYDVKMPAVDVNAEELATLVAYIRHLGGEGEDAAP
jgi:mono/diheme cytochrome c family protein